MKPGPWRWLLAAVVAHCLARAEGGRSFVQGTRSSLRARPSDGGGASRPANRTPAAAHASPRAGVKARRQEQPRWKRAPNPTAVEHGARRTLVSYAFFYRAGESDICRSNFEFFLRHGLSNASDVRFVIHVIGETPAPSSLASLGQMPNVEIRRVGNCGADLCTHGQFLQGLSASDLKQLGAFIFLNCGSRGPYSLRSSATPWYDRFREHLQGGGLKLVGPTMACILSKHVQSYAIGASPAMVPLLVARWGLRRKTHKEWIYEGEVGLSREVLAKGGELSALGLNGCDYGPVNPYGCVASPADSCRRPPASLASGLEPSKQCRACQHLEPTHVLFIKNGGQIVVQKYENPVVSARAKYLENSGLLA